MKTQGLKASLTATVALAVSLPVSALRAGETNVTLGQGDIATVRAGGKEVVIDFRGNVKIQDGKAAKTAESRQMWIGQYVLGKGIYVGQWRPEGLSQTFNLYADKQDLGKPMTFNETVKYMERLKNHDGHDGFNHDVKGMSSEEVLYKALRSGTYKGEWFIPPEDVLLNELYANRKAFSDESRFRIRRGTGSDHALWYWSCTEHSDDPSHVWIFRFMDGGRNWYSKDDYSFSSRLVRVEPVAP